MKVHWKKPIKNNNKNISQEKMILEIEYSSMNDRCAS